MKNLLNSVMQSRLFEGIAPDRVEEMLHCLHAVRSQYEKNSYVYNRGDGDKRVGLVLSGSVYTIHEDYFGNRSIVSRTGAGGLFGEAPVMPVHAASSAEFIARGGRIPAPLQSLKN